MDYYLYDGSLEGYFTAVFDIYKNKLQNSYITSDPNIQPTFDSKINVVETDSQKSQRIKNYITNTCGHEVYTHVRYALASCNHEKGNIVYAFLSEMFLYGKETPFMLSNPRVAAFFDESRKVSREQHRMRGFIRLKQCEGDIYYASFTPDHDVTQFIISHFARRFSNQKFMLHDTKHGKLGMYDGNTYKIVDCDLKINIIFTEAEQAFTDMWKMYYNTINIESRKNTKLMKNFMPVRYHKFMSEKDDLINSLDKKLKE